MGNSRTPAPSADALASPAKKRCLASRSEPVTVHCDVDYLVIEDKLAVYRQSVHYEFHNDKALAGLRELLRPSIREGFAEVDSIKAFLSGKTDELTPIQGLQLVSPTFKKTAREEGFDAADTQLAQYETDNAGTPLIERFASGSASVEDVLHVERMSHMLFDRHGKVLPTAIFFNYSYGNFCDGAYRLDAAIQVLENNPSVQPSWSAAQRFTVSSDKWVVHSVPGYNVSRGCSQYLQFWFQPSQEQMEQLWAEMQRIDKVYPSTKAHVAVFNLDMLGLRAAGAARYDSYYKRDDEE